MSLWRGKKDRILTLCKRFRGGKNIFLYISHVEEIITTILYIVNYILVVIISSM